ncbi:MAG: VWA domain-containing protein [Chloroflexi bacterium CFX7]|nr:VWA domain-containing protein [Chloroflexi bacterium CFX7]
MARPGRGRAPALGAGAARHLAQEGNWMSGLSFGNPLVLLALPLALGAFALWELGTRRAIARARAVTRAAAPGRGRTPAVLLAAAAACLAVAAAAPRWGSEQTALRREGADVVVVLDVSRSMAATDVAPSRLQSAKDAVTQSLKLLSGDRVGLVVFGGSARLRFPLTTDLDAAAAVVSTLEPGPVFVSGGTDTASALDVAVNAFDSESRAGRIVLLITDGENIGPDPASAAVRFRAAGIKLLIAGAGTSAGARVPEFDATNRTFTDKLGADGKPLLSKLNEPFLQALAAASDGRYLGADPRVVPGVVSGQVAALERARLDEKVSSIPIERFQWFVAAALVLLLLASLAEHLPSRAPARVRALTPGLALLALVLLPACATRAHDLNGEGRRAFENGDYGRAIDLFYEALSESPNHPVIALNLAAALDREGRHEEAVQAARRALLSPENADRARAYASIGHHQFGAGNLDAALESFKHALLLDPEDADARHDYEVILRIMGPDASQGGEPRPGEPGQGSDEGQGEDQSPGDGQPGEGGEPGEEQPGGGGGASAPGGDPAAIARRIAEIDREVEGILAEAGEELSPSEALRLLELLAERSRIAARRGAFGGSSDPNDY